MYTSYKYVLRYTKNKSVKETFKWKDHEHNFLSFSEMPTKRLFYIANMIWNHPQPKELQIWFTHKYNFSSYYTDSCMLEAVKELSKRTDICPKILSIIQFWYDSSIKPKSNLFLE